MNRRKFFTWLAGLVGLGAGSQILASGQTAKPEPLLMTMPLTITMQRGKPERMVLIYDIHENRMVLVEKKVLDEGVRQAKSSGYNGWPASKWTA